MLVESKPFKHIHQLCHQEARRHVGIARTSYEPASGEEPPTRPSHERGLRPAAGWTKVELNRHETEAKHVDE